MARRVLITRLSWFLAGQLAGMLENDDEIESVIGVDRHPPDAELSRTEYLRLDVRRPVLLRVLEATEADTVVHLGLYSTPQEAGGAAAMHDLNVIGAMHVLAACQRAPSVKRVVVRSSTAVYGADPFAPAILDEDRAGSDAGPRDPFGGDLTEVEGYARELARKRPDVDVVILRFANILGPLADSPLARYLSMPVVPTVLGFDPRLQFIHSDDASELLAQMIRHPVRGTFNAAGRGAAYLSHVIRLGARIELPLPSALLNLTGPLMRLASRGVQMPPHVLSIIRWGRVADTTRLSDIVGFTPRRSSLETVESFYAEKRSVRAAGSGRPAQWEREFNEFLTRKGQERFLSGRVRG